MMNTTAYDKQLVIRAAQMLGDSWALLILNELIGGSKRFGELQDALEKISPQTLSQRLKMLETYGFINRQAYAEVPVRVEYALTDKGEAVSDILRALAAFAEQYMAADENCEPIHTRKKRSPQAEEK